MLHAMRAKLIRDARAEYREALVLWALLAPHQKRPDDPPELPAILQDL